MGLASLLNYKDLRKGLIDHLITSKNINLTFGNKLEQLKLLFVRDSWIFFNVPGKFVLEGYKAREQTLTQ